MKHTIKRIFQILYSTLFDWLLECVNCSLEKFQKEPTPKYRREYRSIRIVDLAGFENFPQKNSFDQLCVNYTEEKMHQFLLNKSMKVDHENFLRDGLNWKKV